MGSARSAGFGAGILSQASAFRTVFTWLFWGWVALFALGQVWWLIWAPPYGPSQPLIEAAQRLLPLVLWLGLLAHSVGSLVLGQRLARAQREALENRGSEAS